MEIGALLRARGHRLTEPRRLVWEVLSAADGHLTAQQITDRVRHVDPSVHSASVYRSLTLLAELNVIRGSNLGVDGASRWEPTHTDDHFHVVCERCGDVQHHSGEIVERTRMHLESEHGFEAATIDLVVTGLCQACTAA